MHTAIRHLIRSAWFLAFAGLPAGATALLVDGQPAVAKISLAAGSRPLLSWPATELRTVHLVEKDSGIHWYDGPAAGMRLQPWLIRAGAIPLLVTFDDPAGKAPERQELVLETTPTATGKSLYPGMVAEIIRLDSSLPELPPPKAFAPRNRAIGTSVPSAPEYAAYPAYRTSQSVLPAIPAPGKPGFQASDYWRMAVAGPNGTEPETQTGGSLHNYPDCPFGDLTSGIPSAVLYDGLLMVETPGVYHFRVTSTLPAGLRIAGQSAFRNPKYAEAKAQAEAKVAEKNPKKRPPLVDAQWPVQTIDLEVKLEAGLAPFRLELSRPQSDLPVRWQVLWQPPGTQEFSPLPSARFLHAVDPEVEAAYQKFTGGCPWRKLVIKLQKTADPELAKLLAGFDPTAPAADEAAYKTLQEKLLKGYQNDPALGGSSELARALLRLVKARHAYLRAHPEQLDPHNGFAKLRGSLLQQAAAWRPFVESCLRQPQLQAEALEARTELERLASILLKRPFFNETHWGTNDGYGDQDNFLVNVWRVAEAWDDPVAYDAACSLMDNHFRYGGDGLHPDGIFSFHCANGRHLNMGGYGDNWMARVMHGNRLGTPWGYTQEQYRRMAEWTLAYEWFFYQGAAAFTTNGRHNSHQGKYNPGYANRLLGLSSKEILAPETREALVAMKARLENNQPLVGNHFFYRHLQMMHRRPDYYLDVKMNSPLVGGIETFAGACPGNLSFGDGVTTLLRHGDEYRALHTPYDLALSLWRYRSLPGTTQDNYESANPDGCNNPDRYRGGGGCRAGGVSDGEFGHCGFEFFHKTRVRKLYAFTETGLVVLAAGIAGDKPSAAGDYSYRSNLNQCALQGDLTIVDDQGQATAIKADEPERTVRLKLDKKYWIEHNGIGYLVLPTGSERGPGQPGELVVRTSLRTTLNRLSAEIMDQPRMALFKERCQKAARQAKVLEIWIDHGTAVPKDASCSYFVCMRPESRKPAEWLAGAGFEILSNTPACQAVRDTQANILHAFFYEPGQVAGVAVKQPASLMLRTQADGRRALTVQDPVAACTRDLAAMANVIQVSVDGKEYRLQMPGAFDPDDRYRGGLSQIQIEKP